MTSKAEQNINLNTNGIETKPYSQNVSRRLNNDSSGTICDVFNKRNARHNRSRTLKIASKSGRRATISERESFLYRRLSSGRINKGMNRKYVYSYARLLIHNMHVTPVHMQIIKHAQCDIVATKISLYQVFLWCLKLL